MSTKIKDSYYFSHDSGARHDIKIQALRMDHGAKGYGIYFMIIETLREQANSKLPTDSVKQLAFDLHENEQIIRTVIYDYNLFVIEEKEFYSARLCRSVDEYNAKRIKYQEAGKLGGQASVKRRLSNGQALKERKVKEIKENIAFVPPDLETVRQYFKENGYSELVAEKAFNGYNVAGWHDTHGKKILNWKQKMINVWFKPENKIQIGGVKQAWQAV
jgi:Domain of unknown function (DUF4373)